MHQQNIMASLEKRDAEEFSTVLFEFDNVSKLDAWKTKLLLKVKKTIMPPEEDTDKKEIIGAGGAKQEQLKESEGFA
jgi:hypothetical protein